MLTSNLVFGVFLAVLLLVPLVIKWELDRVLALPVVMIIGLLAGLLMTLLAAFLGMPRGINWLLAAFFIDRGRGTSALAVFPGSGTKLSIR